MRGVQPSCFQIPIVGNITLQNSVGWKTTHTHTHTVQYATVALLIVANSTPAHVETWNCHVSI